MITMTNFRTKLLAGLASGQTGFAALLQVTRASREQLADLSAGWDSWSA